MVAKRLSLATLLCAVAISACSSGSVTPGLGSPSSAGASARVAFHIHIPKHAGSGKSGHYVSPATNSISISIQSGTQTVAQTNQTLTASSPGCTDTGSLSCTITLGVPPGSYVATVATYDSSARVLSENAVPVTIVAGAANALSIVLDGVPAGVAMIPASGQDDVLTGNTLSCYGAYKADGVTPYPRTLSLYATDADGNLIMGAGSSTLTVSGPSTGALAITPVSSSSTNFFAVTPGSSISVDSPIAITVRATAANGIAAYSGTVYITYAALDAPRIFVLDSNSIWEFDENGNPIGTTFAAPAGASGISYDPSAQSGAGALLVSSTNASVSEYSMSGTPITGGEIFSDPLVSIALGNGSFYLGDGNSGVYVAAENDVGQIARGGRPRSNVARKPHGHLPWVEQFGTVPADPIGMYVSPQTGRIFLADSGNNVVEGYYADDLSFFEYPMPSGTASGVAEDANGTLYASDGNQTIDVLSPPSTTLVSSIALSSGSQPSGIAYNPSNNALYVALRGVNGGSSVAQIDANTHAVTYSGFSGPLYPMALTVAP